ncbi:MAG: family 20 glycosylhydrolase [Clostridia bacterium]|nr:family 20 glycosylhydrolase [Clostridia bacterium]
MVFPRVQLEALESKRFAVAAVTLWAGEHTAKAVRALQILLPEAKVQSVEEKALICCRPASALTCEGYTLQLTKDGVQLRYGAYAGLVRGLATLSLLFTKTEEGLFLPVGRVEDAPVFGHRGVMIDPARGVLPYETLRQYVILAAKARMNVFHLHLTDSPGVAVQLDSYPAEMILPGAYTKTQMAELNELCDTLALELIPELDMPAHGKKLLQVLPELHCQVEAEMPWCVCAGNEETYAFYERAIREICEIFPGGKYFHIGGDELEFSDLTPPRLCHWERCPRCRAKMAEEGIADKREFYYYFVNRINRFVRSLGRQTVMWSEQIDCTRPVGINTDVLMQFWRVAYPGRGPIEGCSMQRQLEMGYTVINSHYPEAYVDLEKYMNTDGLATWRPDERPECAAGLQSRVIGSEVCAWECGNTENFGHYEHSLPSAILLMGDKLWGGRKESYAPAAAAMTRALLGAATPEDCNVFAAVGDVFPPRSEAKCYPDKITAAKEELTALAELLGDNERFAGYEHFAAVYLACVKEALTYRK